MRNLLTLALFVSAAFAQTVTGTLECRVTDASGGFIAGADIKVVSKETALERATKTNHEGYAQLTFLPLGEYTMTAGAAGFGTQSSAALVELNRSHMLEFKLAPTSVSTEVTVTSEAPLLETTRGEITNNVDTKTIEDRPTASRNFLSLVELLPGFQTSGGFSGVNNPTQSSGSYVSFNGTGSRSAAFQIDGVNNDDSSEGQNRQNVNLSAIKEVQVLTNAFSAEFGRGGGAVVLVQTRGGTNQIHGDAYEFLQNEKLNANSYFGNASGRTASGALVSPRAPYRRNQFGYTIGGPIIKNKLFLFHSFEQTRLIQYNTYTRYFFMSDHPLQVGTCRLCVNPADHPHLEQDLKFLQSIIDRFPKEQPNNPNLCDHCYTAQRTASYPDQDYSGRIDYNISSRDTANVRYQYSRQKRTPQALIVGETAYQNNRQQNVGFTETHSFNPTTWGEFRFGLGLRTTMVDIGGDAGNSTPIVRINNPTAYSVTTLGSSGAFPIHRYQTDYQYVYNLSQVRGKHTWKAGTDIRRSHLDDLADNYGRGWWTFAATGVLGTSSRYEGWENFLRGYMTDFQRGYGNFTTYNRLLEFNFYGMDDFKVSPSFTLNLGLRYERVQAPNEIDGKVKYDFGDFNGIQPRFGFAWVPKFAKGTVLRGGFGLYHNRIFQSVFSQNNISLRSLPPYGAYFDYSNPSFEVADPSGGYVWDPTTYKAGRISVAKVDPGLRMPAVQQYHLTIDRQFSNRWMLSVGYARTRGIGLLQNQIINRAKFPILSPQDGILYDKIDPDLGNTNPAPGYISLAQPRTNQRRPDTRYTTVYWIGNNSWSYYNALRVTLKQRTYKGVGWQASYSWSKSEDTGSDITAGNPIVEYGPASANRGLSDFDQRHRLNFNATWDLPWMRQQKGIIGKVLGGWTATTNETFASGNPFTVTAGYDLNADGVSNDRPMLLDSSLFGRSVDNPRTDPKTGVPYSVEQFPLSAFYPTVNTPTYGRPWNPGGTGQGALGRNTFFGQGLFNVDFGLYKSFKVREGHSLTFRAEGYGVTNTPHFAAPTASVLSTSFGRITSTYNPFNFVGASRSDASARVIQLALRYRF
jgi:outer membrane receptor protein involved in Fe transport